MPKGQKHLAACSRSGLEGERDFSEIGLTGVGSAPVGLVAEPTPFSPISEKPLTFGLVFFPWI
jgi:hypothetical protein